MCRVPSRHPPGPLRATPFGHRADAPRAPDPAPSLDPEPDGPIRPSRSVSVPVAACGGVVVLATLVVVVGRGEPAGWLGSGRGLAGEGETSAPAVELAEGGTVDGGVGVASALRAHRQILSVSDAQPLDDGWAVLDRRTARIHLLGPALELRRSVGGRGEGPGEMLAPTQLAPFQDTLLAVLEESTLVLHLFTVQGEFVDRRPVALDRCRSGIRGDLAATSRGELVVVGRCSESAGTSWLVAEVDRSGTATILLERRVTEAGRIDPFLGIGVAHLGGRTHLVQPDGCLLPLEESPATTARDGASRAESVVHCLPEAPPVPIPDSIREAVEARLPPRVAARYRLALPEHLPRVLAADWSPDGTVLELPAEGGALHTAVLRPDGVLHRVTGARSIRAGDDEILVWTQEADGTVFRIVPWPTAERAGAGR